MRYKLINMTHDYIIEGMTCKNCLAKVKSSLLSTAGIESAELRLEKPQATIVMDRHIPLEKLQEAVSRAGAYTIKPGGNQEMPTTVSWFNSYKPVLLIFFYLFLVTVVIQATHFSFSMVSWMQDFMAGFFLVFSFFKMLDIKAFAESYAMYDVVATRWKPWGYLYPFAELALGLAYLLAPAAIATNIAALCVMVSAALAY